MSRKALGDFSMGPRLPPVPCKGTLQEAFLVLWVTIRGSPAKGKESDRVVNQGGKREERLIGNLVEIKVLWYWSKMLDLSSSLPALAITETDGTGKDPVATVTPANTLQPVCIGCASVRCKMGPLPRGAPTLKTSPRMLEERS